MSDLEVNTFQRYEYFIAHLVPGTICFFGLVFIVEDFFIPGTLAFIASRLSKWEDLTVALLILIPIVLFLGLWLDGIKTLLVDPLFRRYSKRPPNADLLLNVDKIGIEKYCLILNEYYYYYEFDVNGAFALLLIGIPLPHYLFEINLIGIEKCFILYGVFVLTICGAYRSGYKHYKKFVSVGDSLGGKTKE